MFAALALVDVSVRCSVPAVYDRERAIALRPLLPRSENQHGFKFEDGLVRTHVLERLLALPKLPCSAFKHVGLVAWRFCGHLRERASIDARLYAFLVAYIKFAEVPRSVSSLIAQAT